ncbi:hypothetical protein [Paractinoplanes hotanensis]|uniref:Uncharacterized protein n=1 Tax=Paractinoplanes hotanensis TaxID=2906497 RepID=A0ABT0Y909_9ACTN|nr:hypothetical protein [Actinoplanes hotanensis]MCM4081993.1 hypothetical protein [Actinoplanes hotanensis]
MPAYKAFAGVDDLHAGLRRIADRHPGVASLRQFPSGQHADDRPDRPPPRRFR